MPSCGDLWGAVWQGEFPNAWVPCPILGGNGVDGEEQGQGGSWKYESPFHYGGLWGLWGRVCPWMPGSPHTTSYRPLCGMWCRWGLVRRCFSGPGSCSSVVSPVWPKPPFLHPNATLPLSPPVSEMAPPFPPHPSFPFASPTCQILHFLSPNLRILSLHLLLCISHPKSGISSTQTHTPFHCASPFASPMPRFGVSSPTSMQPHNCTIPFPGNGQQ